VNTPGETLLSAEEAAACVARLAEAIAPRIDDDWIVVCLLTGGLWFATDLTRALSRLGRNPLFDALWLSSYGDATVSSGAVYVRADLQRPVANRKVLIVDDVLDSGQSLREALRRLAAAGPAEILTAVFARKPWPEPRDVEPDFIAWEAPGRFLAGYGMDIAGRYRGLPGVVAFD